MAWSVRRLLTSASILILLASTGGCGFFDSSYVIDVSVGPGAREDWNYQSSVELVALLLTEQEVDRGRMPEFQSLQELEAWFLEDDMEKDERNALDTMRRQGRLVSKVFDPTSAGRIQIVLDGSRLKGEETNVIMVIFNGGAQEGDVGDFYYDMDADGERRTYHLDIEPPGVLTLEVRVRK